VRSYRRVSEDNVVTQKKTDLAVSPHQRSRRTIDCAAAYEFVAAKIAAKQQISAASRDITGRP
jgi:hypothetical protein